MRLAGIPVSSCRCSEVDILCMARTNIDIDDELVAEVMRRYGLIAEPGWS